MSYFLVLYEGREAGAPVWRFASSRAETCYICADRMEDDSSLGEPWLSEWRKGVRFRTFWKPWATIGNGNWRDGAYSLYLPCSEKDFVSLCVERDDRGGMEVIAPSELGDEHAATIGIVWAQLRPLRYLRKNDLCLALGVPWVYLLGLYYETTYGLFVAETQEMVDAVRELSHGVQGCREIAIQDLAELEKYQAKLGDDPQRWK